MWSAPMTNACASPSGSILHRVGQVDAEVGAVAQQAAERGRVVAGGDHLDVTDAGHHQRGQRIVDQRLVVDGQQLLAGAHRDRIQPGARSAGQDDAAHQPVRSASVNSVAASAAARSSCRNTEVTWSCTTRKAVAAAPRSPVTSTVCSSTTTTPSLTKIRPGSMLRVESLRPPAQRVVALGRAVGVADLDVVAGQRQQGVDVTGVEGVVPRQHGGHLRSRHVASLSRAQNGVRSSQPSQTDDVAEHLEAGVGRGGASHRRPAAVPWRGRAARRCPCRDRATTTRPPRRGRSSTPPTGRVRRRWRAGGWTDRGPARARDACPRRPVRAIH